MSGECEQCGLHTIDCTCERIMEKRYKHLNASLKCIEPPSELPPVKWINVKGREEHEEILRDINKMISLGLDPDYERFVYLRRWGEWLNGSCTLDGKLRD